MIESPFATLVTVSGGEVTHFQMLENSFAVFQGGKSLAIPATFTLAARDPSDQSGVLRTYRQIDGSRGGLVANIFLSSVTVFAVLSRNTK